MFILFYFILTNFYSANLDFDRKLFLPRALALSGNMESRLALNESIYFNPASSAFAKVQSVEAVYSFSSNDIDGSKPKTLNISLVDLGSTFIGGGIGYSYWDLGDIGTEWSVNAMVNRLFLNNKLGAGISAVYNKYKYDILESNKNINFNFGLLYLLGKKTLLGFSAYNLLGDKNDINTTNFSFSIRQTVLDFFSLSIATNYDLEKDISFVGSFEFMYKNGFTMLASIKEDKYKDNTYWGAGIGYNAPKLSLIYGTMNSIYSPNEFKHSIALRSFF